MGTAPRPKCSWTPAKTLPQPEHDRLSQAVAQGLADRLQRLKDASISTVLKGAASEKNRPDLKALLEIIQLANADKLAGVMTASYDFPLSVRLGVAQPLADPPSGTPRRTQVYAALASDF